MLFDVKRHIDAKKKMWKIRIYNGKPNAQLNKWLYILLIRLTIIISLQFSSFFSFFDFVMKSSSIFSIRYCLTSTFQNCYLVHCIVFVHWEKYVSLLRYSPFLSMLNIYNKKMHVLCILHTNDDSIHQVILLFFDSDNNKIDIIFTWYVRLATIQM